MTGGTDLHLVLVNLTSKVIGNNCLKCICQSFVADVQGCVSLMRCVSLYLSSPAFVAD